MININMQHDYMSTGETKQGIKFEQFFLDQLKIPKERRQTPTQNQNEKWDFISNGKKIDIKFKKGLPIEIFFMGGEGNFLTGKAEHYIFANKQDGNIYSIPKQSIYEAFRGQIQAIKALTKWEGGEYIKQAGYPQGTYIGGKNHKRGNDSVLFYLPEDFFKKYFWISFEDFHKKYVK